MRRLGREGRIVYKEPMYVTIMDERKYDSSDHVIVYGILA